MKNRWHEHVHVRQVPKRILPLGLPVETVQKRLVYLTRVDANVHRGGVEEQTEEYSFTPARASRLRRVGQHPVRRVHAPHQQRLRLDRRHRHRVLGHVQHHVGDQHRVRLFVVKRGIHEPRIFKVPERAASHLQGVVLDLVTPRHRPDAGRGVQREVLRGSARVVRDVGIDRDVHREGPVLPREPHVGGWELLAERTGVDLVLDRGAAHHDVLHRPVRVHDGREHVHELLRRRHRVVHPQPAVRHGHHRHPHVHQHVQQPLELVERPHLPGDHLRHRCGLAAVGREGKRPPVRVPPLRMRLPRRLGPEVLLEGDDVGGGVVERGAGERGERGGGDGRRRGEDAAARRVHRPACGPDGLVDVGVVVGRGASRDGDGTASHGGAAIGARGRRSEPGFGRGGDARDVRDGGHVGDVHSSVRVRRGGTERWSVLARCFIFSGPNVRVTCGRRRQPTSILSHYSYTIPAVFYCTVGHSPIRKIFGALLRSHWPARVRDVDPYRGALRAVRVYGRCREAGAAYSDDTTVATRATSGQLRLDGGGCLNSP